MFECLCGYPPFCSENPHETYRKIMNWRESLIFPDDQPISREAEDLIRRLICEPENRLGRNGVEEIKAHPFFYGVNWQGIRNEPSPHVPQLKSITDTSYFPTEELDAVPEAVDNGHHGNYFIYFLFKNNNNNIKSHTGTLHNNNTYSSSLFLKK